MRLVTFNVLHARSLDAGLVDLDRFAAVIAALDPDVLALQEVDRNQPRSHRADLSAAAAEAMGADDFRFGAAMTGEPGADWSPARHPPESGSAAYGVALFSRYPVRCWRSVTLPRIRPPLPSLRGAPRRLAVRREENRVAVLADLDTAGGPLAVAATHLSFVPGWAQWQLAHLRRALARDGSPAVIMGDLNMGPRLPARITGFRLIPAGPTYPADLPRRRIDHVLVRGDVGVLRGTSTPHLPLSDHRALVVELDRRDFDSKTRP